MIKKKLKQNVNLSAIIDNTGNTQDIQQLKIDVAANTANITTNTQDIVQLRTDVDNNTAEIGKFNQITTDLELKFNGLEPKVTQNTNDIAALQTKTDEIDPLKTRVDALEPKVTKNETDIAALDTVVKRDEIRIGLLEIFQTDTENTLQVLENQGNQLEQRVNQNTSDIANINTTLTNVPKLNSQNTFTAHQFVKGATLSKLALKNDANQDPLSLEVTTAGNQGVIKNNAGGVIRYENAANPTNPGDCTHKQYVDNINTTLTNRINTIETSLANGNIVNYVGTYDAATTYAIGQCVTFNDKWYVSKINGNVGHQPDTSPTQWELLSAPAVDLTPYLTKTEASTTYETIANVNALTTRVSTNEQNIATINTTLNGVAKLATDNTFTANNTFNNPITINNAIGIKRSATDISVVELNAQNTKNINIDFNQQSGDYKNYCYFNIRHKHKTNGWVNILNFEFRPHSNEGMFVSTPLGFINFGNNNLKCSRTPTDNDNIANKEYVDTATNGCAKLASANTFSQVNTFNESVNVLLDKAIQMGYDSNTYKLRLGGASGGNDGFIVAPNGDLRVNEGGTGRVNIKTDVLMNDKFIAGLHDPNSDQDAANKRYVDNRTKTYKWEGVVNNGNTQNLLNIGWDKHIIGIVLFRKRSDNQWFCMNSNMSQQIYRLDSGQFCLYGAPASGTPTFNNDYKIFITYIN